MEQQLVNITMDNRMYMETDDPHLPMPSTNSQQRQQQYQHPQQTKQSMGSRHQLAPNAKCAVCNDDASGFHYGVDSCEGCKGFFRRCITQGINFRCSNEEKCQITPFTRNSCQYCRLKRCFQVGMSREASRLGRRPKKVMKSSSMSRGFHAQLSKHIDTKVASNGPEKGSAPSWDYPRLANAALSDMFGCPPEIMEKLSKMMPAMMSGGAMSGMPVPVMPMPQGMHDNTPSPLSQLSESPPMDLSNHAKTFSHPEKYASDSVTHMDLNKWREKQFEVMSKYMHNKDSQSTGDQGPSSNSDTTSSNEEVLSEVSTPSTAESQSPLDYSNEVDITLVSEQQLDRVDLFKSYISWDKKEEMIYLIADVQGGIIESHMEHCYQLRPRVNAAAAELDAKEQSGEDIGPPTGFWAHWMTELLPAIERVLRFLKDVPGFRELPINDQVLLIKKGAFDIVLCQMMPMVDSEKFTILDPMLRYRNTREDFKSMPGAFRLLFENYFVLSREFKKTNITDIETSLICAILGVHSSIEGLENVKGVEKLECLFVQTLHDHVTITYPDEPGRFEALINLIPFIDNTSQAHSNSLHRVKGHVTPSRNEFPPLHAEIFS